MSVNINKDHEKGDVSGPSGAGVDQAPINEHEAASVLDALFQNENIGIAVVQGMPARIVLVNRGISLMTGYSEEELLAFGKDEQYGLIHPDYREMFFQRYSDRLEGKDSPRLYELRIRAKDGSYKWVNAFVNLTEYRGSMSVVVSLVDITASKESELALRESREKYKHLFERSPAGIFYYDNNLVIRHFNRRFVELLGSKQKSLSGFDLHSVSDTSILPCIKMSLKGKKSFYTGPYSPTTGDARIVISMKTEPVYGEDGEITGGVAIIEDMTRQHVTEEALLQSERRFKQMIDNAPLPITVVNKDARMVYSNESSFKLFGYSVDVVPNLETWWEKAYPDPEYRKKVVKEWVEALRQIHETGKSYGPSEHRVTSVDGSVHDIEFHVVPLEDFSFIIMNDMTRHRKAEAELLRTKKIESIGILAGGIAHDFNNILTAILGNVSLARMDIHGNQQVDDILDVVEKATWRAKNLTQQLLTFSQGGAPVRKVTSIGTLLSDTAEFILRGSGVKCDIDIPGDLWNADVDEGQISQVIHNIILNARQAMADSGTLRLAAGNYHCDANELPLKKGDYVRILIQDSGPGISEDILPNIFDPFFTTKASGSGLGLSVTDSIIRKHGGHIRVLRSGSMGTVFEIILPASPAEHAPDAAEQSPVIEANHRILVMDDDELVLDICARMLDKMGYSSVRVKDGNEAISRYREALDSGSRFDCVILDLTIPGGPGGREVIKTLRQIDPDIRAIVSSGYSNDPVMSKFREYGFTGVTAKPYSFDELKSAVNAAVNQH